ncbi:hypothetical protein PVAND_007741 [Polypedilum vanderplanki]|uniref:Small ribosomal subunit protein mS35 mitochondrial conserved domain-containing protein n=1 Tax=Polypedilum vanderplanki TaxID=319348 RepID=A0A9J6C7L8_POLVA|nr:hypothetical protein PVAND_007741 [Polypedilum vanderplanki]
MLLKNIRNFNSSIYISSRHCFRPYSQGNVNEESYIEDEFRVLNLRKTKGKQRENAKKSKPPSVPPPRYQQMATDQDWSAVWPGPRSFHPATVPLPLRQGWVPLHKTTPGKFANAELMKIPNFLHLTPPAISKQCEALKKFCTPWPKILESEEQQEKHFPVKFISSDYVHGLPTIRNPLSRIVTIKLNLDNLQLDKHAKDKFLRLVGERYNEQTNELTIVTDRCPLKQQNYDYAMYLLTALYHESNITEEWENTKQEADMEYYDWHRNKSKVTSTEILNWRSTSDKKIDPPQGYINSVETLMNEGENDYNLNKYKEEVIKMLGLS